MFAPQAVRTVIGVASADDMGATLLTIKIFFCPLETHEGYDTCPVRGVCSLMGSLHRYRRRLLYGRSCLRYALEGKGKFARLYGDETAGAFVALSDKGRRRG